MNPNSETPSAFMVAFNLAAVSSFLVFMFSVTG